MSAADVRQYCGRREKARPRTTEREGQRERDRESLDAKTTHFPALFVDAHVYQCARTCVCYAYAEHAESIRGSYVTLLHTLYIRCLA